MRPARTQLIALGLAAIAAVASVSAVAAPIGSVVEVVNLATRQLPGAPKLEVRLADSLLPNELLETAADARLKVEFVDGSILMLGPSSQAVLDGNLIDLAATGHKPTLDLNVGSFLFNSEYRGAERMRLRSPMTVIDLRGTSLQITVADGGATEVAVTEGAVYMRPIGLGRGALVEGGWVGRVDSPDSDVVVASIADATPATGNPGQSPGTQPAESTAGTEASDTGTTDGGSPDGGATDTGASDSSDAGASDTNSATPPGQSNGTQNNSGHDDGTNPGKGDENGRKNGGTNNPGKG